MAEDDVEDPVGAADAAAGLVEIKVVVRAAVDVVVAVAAHGW